MAYFGTLYFFTGKMGAGKSTISKKIARDKNAILLSEDEILEQFYPNQIKTFDDYLTYSNLIKPFIKSHVQNLLRVDTNVVMDFPGNTQKQRKWLSNIAYEINVSHKLIYLNISDETCLQRLKQRNIENPERANFDTLEMFNYVSQYFEKPNEFERLNIVEITQ
ncbi:AAA family ATPase [Staphylococcus xylosus]|uniref:AAA family ATPase n=2 Tax=Staphylococcus xylosus TaxID=1288 RepID=UPI0011A18E3C|nr:ATP-binding protein [Staphylococcus xylosus]MCE7786071.1 ATP-binding protein [Staphylococcus xylosus]